MPVAASDSHQQLFAQIEAGLTPQVRSTVKHFAYRRYLMLQHAGLMVDDSLPDQIFADVVTDTTLGRLSWNPDRVKLSTHLCGAIKSRTHQMLLKHRKHTHVSLSGPAQDVLEFEPTEGEIEAEASITIGSDPKEALERGDALTRLRIELRAECVRRGDEIAVKLVDNFALDSGYRRDFAAIGLSERDYDAARKRLLRMAQRLVDAKLA